MLVYGWQLETYVSTLHVATLHVETTVPGLLGQMSVRTSHALTSKHAFCKHHHTIASEMKIPTDV